MESPWSETWTFTTEVDPCVDRYKKMQFKLLPLGTVWNYLSEKFKLLLEAIAAEACRVDEQGAVMIRESHPGTSTLAIHLPDWEAEALLPDELPQGGETEAQRQQVVAAKITTAYSGPSRQFFVDLAAKLGMTIAVTDTDDFSDSTVARVDEARVDEARVSDSTDAFIWQIEVLADPNSQLTKLQAMVARLKPAHTIVVYI